MGCAPAAGVGLRGCGCSRGLRRTATEFCEYVLAGGGSPSPPPRSPLLPRRLAKGVAVLPGGISGTCPERQLIEARWVNTAGIRW
eukprot:COSAG01_NODE_1423_length_10356_cov_30.529590_11_plen_85_part_00